jgi:uncharacterized protein (DUF302 family)
MPVVKRSRYPYTETISRLVKTITDGGNTIFAVIDQAAAARTAGLTLRPTTLIVFGNPKGGTLLMDAFPPIALDLPLKLLVWQDGDSVSVAYTPADEIAARYDVTGKDALVTTMDAALSALSDSVGSA